jgi:hypothetical protein
VGLCVEFNISFLRNVFPLTVYIKSQISRIWKPETWVHYVKTLCIYQRLVFGGQLLKKESGTIFLTEN